MKIRFSPVTTLKGSTLNNPFDLKNYKPKINWSPLQYAVPFDGSARTVTNAIADLRERLANPKMCSLGDEYVEELRATFDARIVG